MIERLELKNFTAFNDLSIDFSAKINVIIGENGTGKTHLMKAAYVLGLPYSQEADIVESITSKLVGVFKPENNRLGGICHKGPADYAKLSLQSADSLQGDNVAISFHTNSVNKVVVDKGNINTDSVKSVIFIPAKEVLSFIDGFVALSDKYQLSFDETYRDICQALSLPIAHYDRLEEKVKWAMKEIEQKCGGKFIFNGTKVIFKSDKNSTYSVNMIAEGFRKLGILYRLIENQSINPGTSGTLFWDEPEANMNPKLLRLLVEILLELSRKGQQIVLATHDYVLLKWFNLLMDKGKDDHVRFHILYRDSDTNKVVVESTDDYHAITPNAIAETFNDLTIAHAQSRLKGAYNE